MWTNDEIDKIKAYALIMVNTIEDSLSDVNGKTVKQLKEMLKSREMKQTGIKSELIARLQQPTVDFEGSPKHRKMGSLVSRRLIDLINRYGDTGFGDKPQGMCRVEYWLAHIEPNSLSH